MASPTTAAIRAMVSSSLSGIGRSGNEKRALRDARQRRLRAHVNFLDGRAGWTRLQPQAKQFQQKFCVARGNGQFQDAGKCARSRLHPEQIARGIESIVKGRLQFEIYLNRGDGKRTRRKPRTQLIEKPAQKKRKRFEIVHRFVQFEPFFEVLRRLGQQQRARAFAAGDGMQTNSFLPDTFRKRKHRQRCESLAGSHAPAIENVGKFLAGRKHADRKRFQKTAFFAFRNDGRSGQEREPRCARFPRLRKLRREHSCRVRKRASAISRAICLLIAEERCQAGNIDEQRVRRGIFHARRDGPGHIEQRGVCRFFANSDSAIGS